MSAKISAICLKFSVVSFFLLLFQAAQGQDRFAAAGAVIEGQTKLIKQNLVLVVATKDTTVYQKEDKAFGAARGQAPLGLSSQWLTAALVMMLVDEGKISLDDKVSQYLPALPVAFYGHTIRKQQGAAPVR